ncbi:MAG: methyl-accepting chemotaxis protein [Candidatus Aminicenantes bacterium]|nr:MAG: methyl-accepting chemotaxis protein [Candidatus Aminicenantes bacterium]
MNKRPKRRKFPIVDRTIQYKFLTMILSYGMIIIIFMGLMLFLPDVMALSNEDLSMEIRGAAAQRILTLHTRAWPAIIALVCILSIHSFRTFHKVIGPLYRFRWAFSRITKGDLNFRVKLRKKDYLKREEEIINGMMDVLAKNWGSIQEVGQNALRSLDDLENSLKQMDSWKEVHQQSLHSHRQHLENLMDKTQYFRLSDEGKEEQESAVPSM